MVLQLDYDPDNPLPDLRPVPDHEKRGVEWYLNAEASSMAAPSYLADAVEVQWRERAVIVIFNVSRQEQFEPFIPYLAMNYFDRYISREKKIPKVMKHPQHDLELLSICCLTLAIKMRNKKFSTPRFIAQNRELRFVTPWQFLTMELDIVKRLDWRVRSVTALCFVPFFAHYFESPYGFRRRSINQIIIQSQDDFVIARFRPSSIAVSAFLAASSFLYPERFDGFLGKIASRIIFNEDEVLICTKKLIKRCKDLRIVIESIVPKNEYLPKKMVRAGNASEQNAAETSDQGASEKSKQEVIESYGQVAAETSTEQAANEKSKEWSAESSKQVAAERTEQSTEEHKQRDIERSREVTAESPEEPTVALTEQLLAAPKPQGGSVEEPKNESSEEVVNESSQRWNTVLTNEFVSAEKSEASTEKLGKSEESEQAGSESFEQQKEAADDSKCGVAEPLEQLSAEESKQVVIQKTEESTTQESAQATSTRLIEAATEPSEQSTTEGASLDANTSSQRPSKGKEKVVEMTELPKREAESDDMDFEFVLRWPLGERNVEGFAIFTKIEELEGPVRVNQGPQSGTTVCNFCGCCNCNNCFNRCSLL